MSGSWLSRTNSIRLARLDVFMVHFYLFFTTPQSVDRRWRVAPVIVKNNAFGTQPTKRL